MYLPEGPCLGSLPCYQFQYTLRKVLEIKKEQSKNKQKNKMEYKRNIDIYDCVTVDITFFFSN